MSKSCSNCGAQLKTGTAFCSACGAKTQAFQAQTTPPVYTSPVLINPQHVKKQGHSNKKVWILAVVLGLTALCMVMICIIAAIFLPRVLDQGGYPARKGVVVSQSIHQDQATTVGEFNKTGWQIKIPENTLKEDTDLTMQVLSEDETDRYRNGDFEFVGTPVQISTADGEGAFLNQIVTVTLQIPEDQQVSEEQVDDYVAIYYNGSEWEYIFPDVTQVSKGYVTFATPHFSLFGVARLTDEKKSELYAKQMAVQVWEEEAREEDLIDQLRSSFDEAYKKMGVESGTVRGELIQSIARETDFGTLVATAKNGELPDFTAKCGEMATNALIKQFKLKNYLRENIASQGAAIASGLMNAAVQVYDGNYTDAVKELTTAFVGYFPAGRAYQAAIKVIGAGIGEWKDYELEWAYETYLQDAGSSGEDPYSISDDDWDRMTSAQIAAYIARLQKEAKDEYCKAQGISHAELDADQKLSKEISDSVVIQLRKKFERRLKGEETIRQKTAEYERIIADFKRDHLLDRGSFGFEIGMDINDRLRSLFVIRENILDLVGGQMPVMAIGESAEGNLNEAIAMWLYYGKDRRGEFYDWMMRKGYIAGNGLVAAATPVNEAEGTPPQNVPESSATPEPREEYAWVLAGAKTNDWQKRLESYNKNNQCWHMDISSAGESATFTVSYVCDDNLPYKTGMSASGQVAWSTPPEVIRANEPFSLHLDVDFLRSSFKTTTTNWMGLAQIINLDQSGKQKGGAIYMSDGNGDESFTTGGGNNLQSHSVDVSGTLGSGVNKGDKIAVYVLASCGVNVETYYVYEWKQVGMSKP